MTSHNLTSPSSLASAALRYASHGWAVFPLAPKLKTPAFNGGVNDATTDRKTVENWWRKNPNFNIGIALAKSGLMCIDIDIKPQKGIDGRKALADECAILGRLDGAALQITASGARHYVFKRRDDLVDKVAWAEGVDILTKGHRYIVAEPSRTDRGVYKWRTELEPWDEAGALPAGWAKALRASLVQKSAVADGPLDLLDTASLRVGGVTLDELTQVLAVLDPAMCRDEWLCVIWGAAAQWAGSKDEQAVIDAIEEWSSKTETAGQYKEGEVAQRWAEHTVTAGGTSGAGHVTWRSVRAMAREAGWTPTAIRGVDPKRWKDALQYKATEMGKVIKPTAWNAALFLAYDPDFRAGVRRNLLNGIIELHKPELAPLRDKAKLPCSFDEKSDWVGVCNALNGKIPAHDSKDDTVAAVRAAADVHAYDPMKDWIDGLRWDGVNRINSWLQEVCGVEDSPLMRAMGRAWLIGLAARASSEADGRGVKMDSVLVLQGGEGIGKSSVGSILGGDWFSEFSSSLEGDEAYYVIERSMVLEFSELDSLSRSEATRVKALVTAQADTFRRKYDANAAVKPRRCVFIGTTNESEFLTKDMTMRRWWVVPCGNVAFNLRWLRTYRDQLIAEAKVAWDRGELPILPLDVREQHRALVATVQSTHPFEEAIQLWSIAQKPGTVISNGQAVEDVLGRSCTAMSVADKKKFNNLMPLYGWERVHVNGIRSWRKPE